VLALKNDESRSTERGATFSNAPAQRSRRSSCRPEGPGHFSFKLTAATHVRRCAAGNTHSCCDATSCRLAQRRGLARNPGTRASSSAADEPAEAEVHRAGPSLPECRRWRSPTRASASVGVGSEAEGQARAGSVKRRVILTEPSEVDGKSRREPASRSRAPLPTPNPRPPFVADAEPPSSLRCRRQPVHLNPPGRRSRPERFCRPADSRPTRRVRARTPGKNGRRSPA